MSQAQDIIYFNNTTTDKKNISIEKLVSGVEFNIDPIRMLPGQYMGLSNGSIETQINYFHENRISNTCSLYKSVGFSNSFYNTINYIPESYTSSNIYLYNLAFELKIGPRWYFNYKSRYMNNKNIQKNSAWFLALPLTVSTNLIRQTADNTIINLTDELKTTITTPLTIGFRNAINKKLFFEVSIGYQPYYAWIYNQHFVLKTANKIGLFSADSFNSEIKIGYTF